MTFEEDIRLRQAFDREVGSFLQSLAGLTTGELELATGRVADRMLDSSSDCIQHTYGALSRVLHLCLEIRLAGAPKANRRQRGKLAQLITKGSAEFRGKKSHALATSIWKVKMSDYERQLEEWR